MRTDHQLYSYTYLYKITSTSPSFIQKMIALFIHSVDEYIIELEKSMQTKNFAELQKVLHKMKPSVINLEVKGAGDELALVAAETEWNDAVEGSVSRLMAVLNNIRPYLQEDLKDFDE